MRWRNFALKKQSFDGKQVDVRACVGGGQISSSLSLMKICLNSNKGALERWESFLTSKKVTAVMFCVLEFKCGVFYCHPKNQVMERVNVLFSYRKEILRWLRGWPSIGKSYLNSIMATKGELSGLHIGLNGFLC